MPVDSRLKAYQALVEARLEALLPSQDAVPVRLHEAMRYSALAPGKRIRPALCMAAAEAAGGRREQALDAGCACEFVHVFSLIHDDLPAIDNDDLRRGRATCHRVFGEALAILAGDALFALAFEVVSKTDAPADHVQRLTAMLASATGSGGLVGGEVLDILGEGEAPDRAQLELIHRRKTGALITACCAMGAVVAGADEHGVRAAEQYGENVGIAFQITDDLLNETSTAEVLGKAVGSDRALGKQTYPAVMGHDGARAEAVARVERAIQALGDMTGDTIGLEELARFSIERES